MTEITDKMKTVRNIATSWMGWACACLVLTTGCNESYPGIQYEESDEVTGNVESSDSLPIMLTVNAPQLSFATRGTGAIDEENSIWKTEQTRFYVYAFLANNNFYDGPTDYTRHATNPQNDFCLVDDPATGHGRMVRFERTGDATDADGGLEWADGDGKVYYNYTHQDYKYDFFLYHIDDATVSNFNRQQDEISFDVEIDGTQDIISGVASPSGSDIERLENESNKEFLYDLKNEQNYVYSTLLAHRGVHPNFKVRHELVRFRFFIKKGDEMAGDISIRDIIIHGNDKARFTVAAQDAEKVGLDFAAYPKHTRDFHLPEKSVSADGSISYTPTDATGINPEKYDLKQMNVGEMTQIGDDLLMASQCSYMLTLRCQQKIIQNGEDVIRTFSPVYTLSLQDTPDIPLTPGALYNVNISVYGLQEIQIQTEGLEWKKGHDINLDDEEMTD